MTRSLTPDQAKQRPDEFKAAALQHMAETTELGARAWNAGVNSGTVKLSRFELNTDAWHSQSNGAGRLILGTEPMSPSERARLLYRGDRLEYADEVTLRLLHELGHGALYLARSESNMNQLLRLATDIRVATGGELGLSALGSHPFYRDPIQDKAVEDTAELLRKRMKSRDHLVDYTNFLSDPRFDKLRREHGVAGLDDAGFLAELTDNALEEAFRKAERQ